MMPGLTMPVGLFGEPALGPLTISNTANITTQSASASIGTASSDRHVVVACAIFTPAPTFNGSAMTDLGNGFYIISAPTGTTATIAQGSNANNHYGKSVFAVYGLTDPFTPYHSVSGGEETQNINITARSVTIGRTYCGEGGTNMNATWSGLTEVFEHDTTFLDFEITYYRMSSFANKLNTAGSSLAFACSVSNNSASVSVRAITLI